VVHGWSQGAFDPHHQPYHSLRDSHNLERILGPCPTVRRHCQHSADLGGFPPRDLLVFEPPELELSLGVGEGAGLAFLARCAIEADRKLHGIADPSVLSGKLSGHHPPFPPRVTPDNTYRGPWVAAFDAEAVWVTHLLGRGGRSEHVQRVLCLDIILGRGGVE